MNAAKTSESGLYELIPSDTEQEQVGCMVDRAIGASNDWNDHKIVSIGKSIT